MKKNNIEDIYQLSPMQQGMLFHTLYAPDSGVYSQQFSCTFTGSLDVKAFDAAWHQVVARHVVLRTAFKWERLDKPLQVVYRQVKVPLEIHSMLGVSPEQQQQQLATFKRKDQEQGFQLSKPPLLRLTLIQMSDDVYQFVWSYHHILIDGWSLPLVFKEVLGCYEALSMGKELQLPPSRSYREYIAWLQKQKLEVAEQFWRQTLNGVTAPTPLVIDQANHLSAQSNSSYSEQILELSQTATCAVGSFARQHQLTLNTLVQAAWAILLSRYSGETDVVFGVAVSGRSPAIVGVESIVGLLINTLPMRVRVSGKDTVLSKLKQIHLQQVEISQYEYTPLVQIQGWSDVPRGLPLFESIVVFENYPVDAALQQHSQKLHISDVRSIERTNYPLTVIAQPGVQLSLRFIADSQHFDSASVTRMVGHFQMLLQGLVANPDQKVSHISMLSATELHQILVEWNQTLADDSNQLCLHSLFEQQVEKTPDAVAVVFEEQRLTYRKLNTLANQLAHYLQRLGVEPEVLVGVCVDRSISMVVGILGILKAGGAYVPLDPTYPSTRLAFMLSDSQVSVLLTQEKLLRKLPRNQASVVVLDRDWEAIAQHSQSNCVTSVAPNNLAYVIYTSGSTGNPKGVAIEHHSPVTLVHWAKQVFTDIQCAGVLASTSICFDLSVFELFVPLSCGGKIILTLNALHLPSLPFCNEVTLINTVPSAIAELQRMDGIPASVQTVNLAGEALQHQLVQKIYQQNTIQQIFNLYGPSEDTTYSTFALVEKGAKQPPSIGRPIANTQVYILDAQMQPVPVGVAGELHIGGMGVARGYLNRPELTAEKFIPNPFAPDKPNSRLYKTGDLARYSGDGNIEYLGRIDHQVKVRGFRIELGEIEAVLSQHPNVQQTVVIATQELVGAQQLVAYLVALQQPSPTISELRTFLFQKLPEYMVPSYFMVLDTLPLTPNGKLDRRALPKPFGQPELSQSFVAPQTPMEQRLANIWASVLGIESVGIHDNFFELGGDSILSIQIVAKANSTGVQLSTKQMFENQTIAELAAVVTTVANQAQQGVVSGTLPLTPIQHWFFEQNFANPAHWNQAVLLSMPPGIQPHLLEQVVHQLLVHHDALRLRFQSKDSGWQQINAVVDQTVPFTIVDLSTLPPPQQTVAIEAKADELQASLNLSTGPLVQVAWFNLGEELNSRLLVVIHHLAVDGVSWRILLEDLQTAYSQLGGDEAIKLPPKTTAFKDWAQRQWEYVQSQDLQQHLDFWLAQSQQPVASIPLDYLDGANTEASARTVSMSLSTQETRALLFEVPKAYNTQINDLLLTALVQVLGDWTNSSYVRFNLEGHGREEIWEQVNVSRTVGWFTTIFPVAIQYTTNNPAEALKSIKEQLRRLPLQGMSYGWLYYLLDHPSIAAQLTTQGSAQIVFNHLGQFDSVQKTSTLFQLVSESSGASRSPRNHRSHLLEVNSIIIGAQLRVDWTYSENLHLNSTIEALAHEFLQALRGLITHCLAPDAGGFTPTDFPLAQLNNVQLEQLLSNVGVHQAITTTNWKNIADIYPLSSVQQGMLFHNLYAPDSGVYSQQFSCTFTGSLDVKAFDAAWQQVVARHVVLRTAFKWEDLDKPLQVVYQQVVSPVEIHSMLGLDSERQQQQLATFKRKDQEQGFQLSKPPLMRLTLIQMSDDVYEFVWSYHHILIDGWSLPLVFKEVLGFYKALSVGQELQLPPSRSYREYIAWLQKQKLEVAEEFWRQTLQGVTAPTPLVVERAHQSLSGFESYSEHILSLSQTVTSALVSFARQHQLTLNTLVQAAWAILLARYSGETDVVFGVTVSGRSPAIVGVESIVGLFINTLPMRVRVLGEETVLSKLKQIHKQQADISQYEYTPLVQIQEWSDVPRGLPLFESIVVFENYPVDAALQQHSQKLHISDVHTIERTNYPLTVIAQPGVQLSLRFIYSSQRFQSAAIALLAKHFQTLLSGMIANPFQQLSDLPMMKATELDQILVEWNQTQVDYPKQLCIHDLFEQQVQLTPDAVAVVFEDQILTYGELNKSSNQLAHYLQALGVGPEVLVGLCIERSIEMVVGLLGILKAGGAYLPLDPAYPQERLTFMLLDASVPFLLTQERLIATLPEHQAQVVCLDADWLHIANKSEANLYSKVTPEHLAYVIYTSGSTGTPKGVQILHGALVNFLNAMRLSVDISQKDTLLSVTTLSFDIAALELYLPLIVGASVVLVKSKVAKLGTELLKRLSSSGATVMQATPATWRLLLASGWHDSGQLKILCGGEALPRSLANQLRERGSQVWNLYGPTETTIWSAIHKVETLNSASSQDSIVSIGRPIANTQFYILDKNEQPVPVGVPGELHIGGVSIARGYLRRPELTSSKFIVNPFSHKPGERLYKTGDMVRYKDDGNLEYLGRIDEQVKIRGFRIELGEIEALLNQHPKLRESVVIAFEDIRGDKRLVAYIVPHQEQVPTITDLRAFLKQKLPEYMVPSAFVVLDTLPLTPNGKVNRKALPDSELAQAELEKTFVAPRTPTEEVMAQIWTQVLRLEQVSVNDNFFDFGGHSLTATQLLFSVQNTFKVKLPLHALLETPTVAGMASAIDNVRDCKPTPPATIPVTDLNLEAVLDDIIRPASIPVEYVPEPARIFLTGATGFLGAFLLYELLQQTNADIYSGLTQLAHLSSNCHIKLIWL